MAKHYSSKEFFRQVPNALLGRYFRAQGLMPELDFAVMSEGNPEPLFVAWAALSDAQRNAAEADFLEICEETQGVVPHDAEAAIDSALAEPVGKVLRDREFVHARRLVVRLRARGACPREATPRERLRASPRA